jgi:ribonuclease HI
MKPSQLSHFRIVVDGGCRANGRPEAAPYGSFAVIAVGKDGTEEVGRRQSFEFGEDGVCTTGEGDAAGKILPIEKTSNAAEYRSLLEATRYMLSLVQRSGIQAPMTFIMDSQLVMDQLSGRARVKARHLKAVHAAAAANLAALSADWHWRPREEIVKVLGH